MKIALSLVTFLVFSLSGFAKDPPPTIKVGEDLFFRLGVVPKELDPSLRAQLKLDGKKGVLVLALAPHGPARLCGIQENDVLLKIGAYNLSGKQDLAKALVRAKVGDKLKVLLLRGGEEVNLEVKVEKEFFLKGKILDKLISPNKVQEAVSKDIGVGSKPSRAATELKGVIEDQAKELFEELAKADDSVDPKIAVLQIQELRNLAQSADIHRKGAGAWMPGKAGLARIRVRDERGLVEIVGFDNTIAIYIYNNEGQLMNFYPYTSAQERQKVPQALRKRIAALKFNFK